MGGNAWVTLATNDSYSLGALVLAQSLKQVGTNHQLAVLVTPGVTNPMREKLQSVFNLVQEVNILDSKDEANLRLLKRPELGITFTKLHCWKLTQYDKCVFLDADTLVLQNCDELFEREELSAAPDVGWPDCFNSGVFVYQPSNETYGKLVEFALNRGSFDGGDQGLLNLYFSDWAYKDINKHLPFIYNMSSTASYSYLPAYKQFGINAKIVHFIGNTKPWLQYMDSETRQVSVSSSLYHLKDVVQKWWDIFCSVIHPALSPEMAPTRPSAVHFSSHATTNYPESESSPQSSQPLQPFCNPRSNLEPPPPPEHFIPSQNLDYRNVWDPWEMYDENSCSNDQQISNIEINPVVELPNNNNNNNTSSQIECNEPTRSNESHNTNEPTGPSSTSRTFQQVLTKFDVGQMTETHCNSTHIEAPPPFPSSPPHSPHYSQTTFPAPQCCNPVYNSLEPVPITNNQSPDTLPDCNPLARPHECESSCLSNDNALHVQPSEPQCNQESGLAGAFARLTLGAPRSAEQVALEDHLRRQGWEVGNIDYMGRDSFDNIWSKICATLGEPTTKPTAPPPTPTAPTTTTAPTQSSEIQSPAAAPVACPKPAAATTETVAPVAEATPKPTAPVAETPKPVTPLETSKPVTPTSEAPKPATPVTEAPKPATPVTEAPKPATPTAVVPKPETPVAECPKPTTPVSVAPKPVTPVSGVPKPATPVAETPKPEASKSATPITEVPKPATPVAESPKPATPTPQPSKPATPISEVPKPATSVTESPKPATPATESPKPATPVTETPKPATPTSEAPKPAAPISEIKKPPTPVTETPKPATPIAEAPKPAMPVTEAPPPAKPTAEVPKPATPLADIPKPTAQKSEVPIAQTTETAKPTTPTASTPKPPTPTTEVPTPKGEARKSSVPSAAGAKPSTPTAETAKTVSSAAPPAAAAPKPAQAKETPKVAAEASKPSTPPVKQEEEAAKSSEAPQSPTSEGGPTPPPRKADKAGKKPAKGKK